MKTITITEALAEVRTIGKRIEKKRQFVCANIYRPEDKRDPLEKEGGQEKAVGEALQAVSSLEGNIIAIRKAISTANHETTITIGSQTKSIADWLVWRREVAPLLQGFQNQIMQHIERTRQQAQRNGAQLLPNGATAKEGDVIVNIREKEFAEQVEETARILAELDGQLSLKNATTTVEVDA